MVVTISSKGQLVIPKTIRRALAIKPGAKFTVELNPEQQIVLRPLPEPPDLHAVIRSLQGILKDTNALDLLQEERQAELRREQIKYGL
jgi:AbrB family looped-hinge helix DNA binding protein